MRGFFFYFLNEFGVGDVVNWWIDNIENYLVDIKWFLGVVVNMCGGEYCCLGKVIVGNLDIVGIGVCFLFNIIV